MEKHNSNVCGEKYYEVFDIVKFILAFVVVGIHTLGKYGLYPIFRIAVPIFFMISSYLFFSKANGSIQYLKKFCFRNIKLYLFWFFVLSPVFLPLGGYLNGNLLLNLVKLVVKIIFSSSFAASWYIAALVIGTVIVFFLQNRKIPIQLTLLGGFLFYCLCCFNTNYRNLFGESSIVVIINRLYPGTIYNSFLVSIFWIALGCYFANNKKEFESRKSLWGFSISIALLLIEYFLVNYFKLAVDNDCYFMLIPTCYYLFKLLLKCDISTLPLKINTKKLRKHSTIIYCIHGSIATILGEYVIHNTEFNRCIILFFSASVISFLISFGILALERRKGFRWLKYAY